MSSHNGNMSMEVVDSLNLSAQPMEDLKYLQASNVNVANFVSVKLSSQIHYHVWKAQMLCLMESQQMRGIIDANFDSPEAKSIKIIKQYDSLLKGWIYGALNEEVLKNVVGCESARDVWTKLESFYDPKLDSTPPVSIIYPVVETTETNLQYGTDHKARQKTKLRTATEKGRWWEAKGILKNNKDMAKEVISRNGNTMLHLAVVKGQNYFLEKLLNFLDDGEQIEKKNSYGRTALHIAAITDNKNAAELLVRKRKILLAIKDNADNIPLLSAYYNMKLCTYVYLLEVSETEQLHLPLSRYPDDRVQIAVNFLITSIFTKQYDLASTLINIYPELVSRDDQVLMAIAMSFPPKLSFGEAFIYPSPIGVLYPIYQLIRLFTLALVFPFFVLYFLTWKFLAIVAAPVKNIENKQKEYKKAKRILNFICDEIDRFCLCDTNLPYYSGPIFEAVRQDAYKVVQKILSRSFYTIDSKNQDGHNIIQLAVINRSERVYNLFYPIIKRVEYYSTMTDSSMNNLVHLAGRLAPSFVLSRATGAALQLQRELQWREEVEKLMLPTHLLKENIYMETPEMVFTREHANLVKEGELWMKTTAESCSITAALIVTIVFAAAITVPGGSNQETGTPLFRKEVAFTIFAVADAISLFSAATSLLVFLSILTTRFSEKDFLVSLPRRLILGLCVLFISATAMMVAFCATLYLVFCDQRPWMLAPIGGLACLPIAVIATLQFPLVVDLFISTYFPIFHKKKFDFVESEILLRMDEE
ncbi:Ankyrin repeat-containing protein [Artemisia annua]|uniref:Ankyrin repeat-containing protein n=1 Tax=Artemisia annua TaxID=35608 RepID=A0A2U1KT20_ARTAN|nr:Ankyrin repeat-containing protein [Artemisia annua]